MGQRERRHGSRRGTRRKVREVGAKKSTGGTLIKMCVCIYDRVNNLKNRQSLRWHEAEEGFE